MVLDTELAVEPVVVRPPMTATEIQIADKETADTQVAVIRAVKIDVSGSVLLIHFPILGNEVRVVEKVVEQVGVEDWLVLKLPAKLLAHNGLTTTLIE